MSEMNRALSPPGTWRGGPARAPAAAARDDDAGRRVPLAGPPAPPDDDDDDDAGASAARTPSIAASQSKPGKKTSKRKRSWRLSDRTPASASSAHDWSSPISAPIIPSAATAAAATPVHTLWGDDMTAGR